MSGAAARVLNLKTAAVWALAAVCTAVAVSSVSAALERDALIHQGDVRQARLVQLAEQLDELEARDRDAAAQRARLLEEIRGLREQLLEAGVTPGPRPGRRSSSVPSSSPRGSVRPPKPSGSPTPSGGPQTGRSPASVPATPSSSPNPAAASPSPSPAASCRGLYVPVIGCVGG